MIAPIDMNVILSLALAAYVVRCVFLYSMRKLDVTGSPLCTRREPIDG